jgi:hypothetical protein
MSGEPKKLFDLMDTEVEPTDEQLEQLMEFVGEEVRRKHALRPQPPTANEIAVLVDKLMGDIATEGD